MKKPVMITCPHCGKDMPEGNICRHCGKEISFAQGMEVHYKDFKGSEMLDIKMSSHARKEDPKPAQQGIGSTTNGPRSEKKSSAKKTILFLSAGAVIILSAFAWYYLLKLLMKF